VTRALVINNVRAIGPQRIVENATIVLEGGVVAEVSERSRPHTGGLDGRGSFALPGLVDSHSDGLEKEIHPRTGVTLDPRFALRSFEQRVRSAGILTVAHGVGFQDKPAYQRSVDLAHRLCDAIDERRVEPRALVDHRILFRTEARSADGLDALVPRLGIEHGAGPRPLLSFEDHTPGQGQYRDIAVYRSAIAADRLPPGTTIDDLVAEKVEEARAGQGRRDRNWERVCALAAQGSVRLLAHDCEDAAEIAVAADGGAEVAEFPLGIEAATEARRRGMHVVMGAPNVLRGGSHSGNVAAEVLVRAGLCTVLASDYLPASLLASAFALAERGACSLPEAVRLVSAGPADLLGLADRGRLEPGVRAEVVLVTLDGTLPTVRAVVGPEGPVP
jgi:alpha-D-ribose 1-methylphosphonate 5-triphosphate diphosphatase